jgi:putative oxidoreductase
MNIEPVSLPQPLRVVSSIVRVVVAVILLQTLYFKFTAHPDSVHIFTTVGQEPWGRIGSGVVELLASIFLFVPGIIAVGAALSFGVMSSAVFFHLTKLGIVVNDDGGSLFTLAVVVWLGSTAILCLHRRTLPIIGSKL